MTIFQAFILGLVQGITEYLPVSSTAHLMLVPKLFGWQLSIASTFSFNVLVQLGTLIGVCAYLAKDIISMIREFFKGQFNKVGLLILATIPAAVVGLLIKKQLQTLFVSPKWVAGFLMVNAGVLCLGEFFKQKSESDIGIKQALAMGFSQIAALFPGISRSGSTIVGGLISGGDRKKVVRFSFLMSIPVIMGASLLTAKDLIEMPTTMEDLMAPLMVGMLTAAVTGYLAVGWLLRFIEKHSLYWFAAYCLVAGGLGLIVLQ